MRLVTKFVDHAITLTTPAKTSTNFKKTEMENTKKQAVLRGLAQVILRVHILSLKLCSAVAESGERFEESNICKFISILKRSQTFAHAIIPEPSIESRKIAVNATIPSPHFLGTHTNVAESAEVAACIFPALLGYYCSISKLVVNPGCGNYGCDCGSREEVSWE